MANKGSRRERELVNLIDDTDDFAVMRAPASGGGTPRELPDVLAGNGSKFYAIEAKATEKEIVYVDGDEVVDLAYFSEKFGAEELLGFRFNIEHGDPAHGNDSDPGWYFFRPEDLYQTDGGNYRCKKEKALQEGMDFEQLIGDTKQSKLDV